MSRLDEPRRSFVPVARAATFDAGFTLSAGFAIVPVQRLGAAR